MLILQLESVVHVQIRGSLSIIEKTLENLINCCPCTNPRVVERKSKRPIKKKTIYGEHTCAPQIVIRIGNDSKYDYYKKSCISRGLLSILATAAQKGN